MKGGKKGREPKTGGRPGGRAKPKPTPGKRPAGAPPPKGSRKRPDFGGSSSAGEE